MIRSLWVVMMMVGACAAGSDQRTDALVGGSDAAPAGDGGNAGRSIKVMTFNLLRALDDPTFAARTQIVADLIANEQPDLVALQEVTESSSMPNRGQALAQATGYAFTWQQTHELLIGKEGIGLLARGTIAWRGAHELPHEELGLSVLHRYVIGARVTTDEGPLEIFGMHLAAFGTPTIRADQAAEALAFARANHQPGVPAYFAGDLNATPDELGMRMLRGETSHAGITGDLVDAWPSGVPGFTSPADDPERRIDYVYLLPGSGRATSCETVLSQPVNGVRASDHLGVLCEISMPN